LAPNGGPPGGGATPILFAPTGGPPGGGLTGGGMLGGTGVFLVLFGGGMLGGTGDFFDFFGGGMLGGTGVLFALVLLGGAIFGGTDECLFDLLGWGGGFRAVFVEAVEGLLLFEGGGAEGGRGEVFFAAFNAAISRFIAANCFAVSLSSGELLRPGGAAVGAVGAVRAVGTKRGAAPVGLATILPTNNSRNILPHFSLMT